MDADARRKLSQLQDAIAASRQPVKVFPAKLTAADAARLRDDDELINFAVHPALLPALVAWVDSRGADLRRVPTDEDEEPTYIYSPRMGMDD